jgi:hypothetical protein
MTVPAHRTKQPHYRATSGRSVESGRSPRVSMLQALRPQLYKAEYSGKPKTATSKMTQWLRRQPEPVTIDQIVIGSGCSKSVVTDQIRAGHIKGLLRVASPDRTRLYQLRELRIPYLLKAHGFTIILEDDLGTDVYRKEGLEVQVYGDKIYFIKHGESLKTMLTLDELEAKLTGT